MKRSSMPAQWYSLHLPMFNDLKAQISAYSASLSAQLLSFSMSERYRERDVQISGTSEHNAYTHTYT